MALRLATPAQAVRDVVMRRLGLLAHFGSFSTPALRRADPASLTISTPHWTCGVQPSDLARPDLWQNLAHRSWRFLIHAGDHAIAAAEATLDAAGGARFESINEGPAVRATEDAIRFAETQPEVEAAGYEPVLLRTAHLYMSLLGLVDQGSNAVEFVIALPPTFAGLEEGVLLRPEQALTALRTIMERQATPRGRT